MCNTAFKYSFLYMYLEQIFSSLSNYLWLKHCIVLTVLRHFEQISCVVNTLFVLIVTGLSSVHILVKCHCDNSEVSVGEFQQNPTQCRTDTDIQCYYSSSPDGRIYRGERFYHRTR